MKFDKFKAIEGDILENPPKTIESKPQQQQNCKMQNMQHECLYMYVHHFH